MEGTSLKCKAIIEMLGAPKEHIATTLKDFVEKKVKPDYQVVSATFEEPVPAGKLFSTYVELDITFSSVDSMLAFSQDCMPSSLEVYEPEQVTFNLHDLNNLLNDFSARIHQTDKLVRDLRSNINLLNKNSIELLRNYVRYLVRAGNSSIEEISDKIGITTAELLPFLDRMIEDNQLSREGKIYAVP